MKAIKISTYPLKTKSFEGQNQVFDPVRKKFVALTPEEFVRQNVIMHMVHENKMRKNLIGIEYPLKHMGTTLRCDIVIFDTKGNPRIIVECKAPSVKLTQKTIDQAANYNSKLNVDYLIISNGNETYCCKMNYKKGSFKLIDKLPMVDEILI